MKKRMSHNEALQKATENDSGATASDFKDTIKVWHLDGSELTFCSAIYERLDKEWISIRTEHCGIYVFYAADVAKVAKVTMVNLYYNNEGEV